MVTVIVTSHYSGFQWRVFMSHTGLNPVSETFPPWLKYISGGKLNFCHFLDFCGKMFECQHIICYWKLKFQNITNQHPPSNICRLLGYVSPPSPPALSFSVSSCFPRSLWKKNLASVSLVRKSTCPTHTEQNWADLTAAQHSPARSHLYSQAMARHCEATKTVFGSV